MISWVEPTVVAFERTITDFESFSYSFISSNTGSGTTFATGSAAGNRSQTTTGSNSFLIFTYENITNYSIAVMSINHSRQQSSSSFIRLNTFVSQWSGTFESGGTFLTGTLTETESNTGSFDSGNSFTNSSTESSSGFTNITFPSTFATTTTNNTTFNAQTTIETTANYTLWTTNEEDGFTYFDATDSTSTQISTITTSIQTEATRTTSKSISIFHNAYNTYYSANTKYKGIHNGSILDPEVLILPRELFSEDWNYSPINYGISNALENASVEEGEFSLAPRSYVEPLVLVNSKDFLFTSVRPDITSSIEYTTSSLFALETTEIGNIRNLPPTRTVVKGGVRTSRGTNSFIDTRGITLVNTPTTESAEVTTSVTTTYFKYSSGITYQSTGTVLSKTFTDLTTLRAFLTWSDTFSFFNTFTQTFSLNTPTFLTRTQSIQGTEENGRTVVRFAEGETLVPSPSILSYVPIFVSATNHGWISRLIYGIDGFIANNSTGGYPVVASTFLPIDYPRISRSNTGLRTIYPTTGNSITVNQNSYTYRTGSNEFDTVSEVIGVAGETQLALMNSGFLSGGNLTNESETILQRAFLGAYRDANGQVTYLGNNDSTFIGENEITHLVPIPFFVGSFMSNRTPIVLRRNLTALPPNLYD
jgi:hypothetical protein